MTVPAGPLRLARRAKLRWDPVRERPMLLVPEGVLVLNRTGHEIVRRIDGTRSATAIAAELAQAFGQPQVEVDVMRFLSRLAAKGLLEAG
jgi:pyrroloquinoline quinone biosynthesis protein D